MRRKSSKSKKRNKLSRIKETTTMIKKIIKVVVVEEVDVTMNTKTAEMVVENASKSINRRRKILSKVNLRVEGGKDVVIKSKTGNKRKIKRSTNAKNQLSSLKNKFKTKSLTSSRRTTRLIRLKKKILKLNLMIKKKARVRNQSRKIRKRISRE